MKTNRPYTEARRELLRAWQHLKKRRSPGDNEARKMLRSLAAGLLLDSIDEAIRHVYTPALIKHFKQNTQLFGKFSAPRGLR